MNIGYWWESQNKRDHWEDQDVGWGGNIKTDLREIGWDIMDWVGPVEGSCEHGNEPPGSIKCWEVLE
jgi:hypothetical protein